MNHYTGCCQKIKWNTVSLGIIFWSVGVIEHVKYFDLSGGLHPRLCGGG